MFFEHAKSFAFGCLELGSIGVFVGALALWADIMAHLWCAFPVEGSAVAAMAQRFIG